MCILDNPASRNVRKDTELWITQGYATWNHCSLIRQHQAQRSWFWAWTQWEGSLGWGERREERVSSKKKMFQTVLAGVYSQGDWENCPQEGQVNLLPNSQYASVRSLLEDKLSEKGHPPGLPEGWGFGPWTQAKRTDSKSEPKPKTTRHTNIQMANEGRAEQNLSLLRLKQGQLERFSIHQLVGCIPFKEEESGVIPSDASSFRSRN